MLYRLGFDASLTLGNKKSVDIIVVNESGDVLTIDVKRLAGTTSWPVDNVKKFADNHLRLLQNCYFCHPERSEGSRFFGRFAPSE